MGKFISLGFLSFGVFLLMQVVLPVASFQVWEIGQNLSNDLNLISPQISNQNILGVSIKSDVRVENKDNFSYFISNMRRDSAAPYSEFLLTIPRLKIDKAEVAVDSNDINNGLAHLPGAALPGEKGNVFISGHSALSKFFTIKNAVFGKLTELKKEDIITVEVLGTQYDYKVIGFRVVSPSDTSVILPPDTSGRFITLMTCVPPGLNFKRLVVLGKLI